jgi:hypothetical protein
MRPLKLAAALLWLCSSASAWQHCDVRRRACGVRGGAILRGRISVRHATSASPAAPDAPLAEDALGLGIDFGTSGARAVVVRAATGAVVEAPPPVPYGDGSPASVADPASWVRALRKLIDDLPTEVKAKIVRVALDGTSASALLLDARDGTPAAGRSARMYDYAVPGGDDRAGAAALAAVRAAAPTAFAAAVCGPTSTLAKLAFWHAERPLAPHEVCVSVTERQI